MSTESAPASSFGAPPLSITPDLSETFFSNGHDYEPFGDLGRSSSGASHVLVRCKRHVEVGGHALSRSTELFAKLIVIPVGGDAGSNQGVDDVARTIAPFESASHPNLIPWIEHYIWEKPPQQWRSLLNAGENDIVVVIIMERALFGDVRRLWSTVEVFRLSERDALTICAQVASAIQYLQLNSIPCPELKPSKVLVMSTTPDKGFHVCIAPGFGRVRKVSTTDDEAARSKYDGSGDADPYAAPEVLRGQPVTSKAHTWSLGVVLYEMLTGHKLVIDILALRTRLENLKHLSAHVRDVLCNLLTLDPANRPSMEAARTLIQLALAATPATVDQQPEGDSDNPTASPIGSDRSPAKLKLRSPSRVC
jgi:serine/threonine protein kinase